MDALVHFYLRKDPDEMEFDEWLKSWLRIQCVITNYTPGFHTK
jgi:hypothetical protein